MGCLFWIKFLHDLVLLRDEEALVGELDRSPAVDIQAVQNLQSINQSIIHGRMNLLVLNCTKFLDIFGTLKPDFTQAAQLRRVFSSSY